MGWEVLLLVDAWVAEENRLKGSCDPALEPLVSETFDWPGKLSGSMSATELASPRGLEDSTCRKSHPSAKHL